MATVHLGNNAALYKDDVLEGDFISEITVHDDTDPHHDQVRNITHVDGLWAQLSAKPAIWVSCPDLPRLEQALAAHFDCPIGDPHEVRELVAAAREQGIRYGGDSAVENRDVISATVDHASAREGEVL